MIDFDDIPFSWSLRRRFYWTRCRRMYYFYYYGTRGGHDPDAPLAVRRLHRLKSVTTSGRYLEDLVFDLLRRLFYESPEESPEVLAHRQLALDLRKMISGEAMRDHRCALIDSVLDHPGRIGALADELNSQLKEKLKLFNTPQAKRLFRLPFPQRIFLALPTGIAVGDLTCFTSAILVFRTSLQLWYLDRNDAPESALLHRLHAVNQLHWPPEQVRSFAIDPTNGSLRNFGNFISVSQLLRQIREECSEMHSLRRDDGTIDQEDFAPCPGPHCAVCKFQSVCPDKG